VAARSERAARRAAVEELDIDDKSRAA